MLIPGYTAYTKQFVSYILDADFQVKRTGIYFTLAKIYQFAGKGSIDFDRSSQMLPSLKELQFDTDFTIQLQSGTYYIEFNERVSIPKNVFGLFQSRKDLLKCGASLQAFMINPNYSGTVGGILNIYNPNGITLIKHARLGQWIFIEIPEKSG